MQEIYKVLDNCIPTETVAPWPEKDRKNMKQKGFTSRNSTGRKQIDKVTLLKCVLFLREKKDDSVILVVEMVEI